MSDPHLQAALAQIDERWDERRTRSGLERAQRTLRRRRTRRSVLAGAAALGALLLTVWVAQRRQPLTAASESRTLTLADDSRIVLLDAHTELQVLEEAAHATRIELTRGAARFDVARRPERVFAVQSGGVDVRVLGTAFEVERAAERTRVSVLRGRVAVSSGEGRRELTPGESGWFSAAAAPQLGAAAPQPAQAAARPSSTAGPSEARGSAAERRTPASERGQAPAPAQSHEPGARQTEGAVDATYPPSAARANPDEARTRPARRDTRRVSAESEPARRPSPEHGATRADPAPQPASAQPTAAASGWRESAQRAEHARAYALLQQPGAEPTGVDELLLAADAARLSGHPEAALPFLERVVREHARDARASLAAFTLGGVLMQQLGRPREAQAAYARARALAVHASLAQDALARQVEAAQRAGDAAQARELAREYLTRYPDGRRVQAVRRFAGLAAE